MSFSGSNTIDQEIANHSQKLVKAFGGADATSAFLSVSRSVVYRWCDPNEQANMPLKSMMLLERELAEDLNKEPVFSLHHLRALGYEVRRLDTEQDVRSPLEETLALIRTAGSFVNTACEAAEDAKISVEEVAKIEECFRAVAESLSSLRVAASSDAI
ncbi:hypothetical protein ACQU0X_28855 [Pseudovibrio ascidiaceicola]|uniref:hypothetical protein n=1 Tax=Pseudovibrio ascidiaceicola TaxID=285279 RepID=UPI003D35A1C2